MKKYTITISNSLEWDKMWTRDIKASREAIAVKKAVDIYRQEDGYGKRISNWGIDVRKWVGNH